MRTSPSYWLPNTGGMGGPSAGGSSTSLLLKWGWSQSPHCFRQAEFVPAGCSVWGFAPMARQKSAAPCSIAIGFGHPTGHCRRTAIPCRPTSRHRPRRGLLESSPRRAALMRPVLFLHSLSAPPGRVVLSVIVFPGMRRERSPDTLPRFDAAFGKTDIPAPLVSKSDPGDDSTAPIVRAEPAHRIPVAAPCAAAVTVT